MKKYLLRNLSRKIDKRKFEKVPPPYKKKKKVITSHPSCKLIEIIIFYKNLTPTILVSFQ